MSHKIRAARPYDAEPAQYHPHPLEVAIKPAVEFAAEVEREACAKIAEAERVDAESTGTESDAAYNQACDDIAAAIRARGAKCTR